MRGGDGKRSTNARATFQDVEAAQFEPHRKSVSTRDAPELSSDWGDSCGAFDDRGFALFPILSVATRTSVEELHNVGLTARPQSTASSACGVPSRE